MPATPAPSLVEIALLFLRLGATAFGGPAAHIAMMEDEVVRRRAWLTREEFLDLLGATNLIPGPNSTELAIHIGLRAARLAGAGRRRQLLHPARGADRRACSRGRYVRYGSLPAGRRASSYGVKPVVIAIVVAGALGARAQCGQVALRLGRARAAARSAATPRRRARAGRAARRPGAWSLLARGARRADAAAAAARRRSLASSPAARAAAPAPVDRVRSGRLFSVFLKIGSVLFGSGYVLLAFLRADLVERLGWLSERSCSTRSPSAR